jgi:predicted dienelactone hydrolase
MTSTSLYGETLTRPPLRTAALLAMVALALAAPPSRADSLATMPPLGTGPYAVGCSSVEQDFSRVPQGQNPEWWWEGVPSEDGTPRYVTALLSSSATPVLTIPVPDDGELYGPHAGTSVQIALVVCYPTDADNPYADYALPTGKSVPHMQRGGDPPLLASARARWPVLLYSHGYAGSPISGDYISVLTRLASHGYAVVAPFHGDQRIANLRLEDASDLLNAIANFSKFTAMQAVRPLALAAALDHVLDGAGWKDRLDATQVAGFGASQGGESLMLMAGAKLTVSVGLSSKQVMSDPRLKAITSYVPYFGQPIFPAFGRDQSGVDGMLPVPVLAISGTADTTAPIVTTEKAMRRLAQSRILVALEGVEHGFDLPSTGDIFTWTLVFLAAHAQDDRSARATLQRMERVAGGGDDRRIVDYTAPAPASGGERIVVEFQNDELAHFFYTADADEAAMLDAGVIVPGWRRTGFAFKAWDRSEASGDASCRYFTSRDGVYSHFYSIWAPECAILAADPLWRFEAQAYRAGLPAAEDCPAGRMRVTRVYNLMDGGAPNHRFLTSASEIAHMADEDWLVEGSVFCTPP